MECIRHARKQRGLSQSALGHKIGVTKAEICRLEGADDVRHSTLERVAKALKMRVSELVAIGEEKEKHGRSQKRV